jgi:hypothetical protein
MWPGAWKAVGGRKLEAARAEDAKRCIDEGTAGRLGLRPVKWTHRRLALEYRPDVYAGEVVVVKVHGRRPDVPALGWDSKAHGTLEEVEIPFHPSGALAGGNAARVADVLSRRMS